MWMESTTRGISMTTRRAADCSMTICWPQCTDDAPSGSNDRSIWIKSLYSPPIVSREMFPTIACQIPKDGLLAHTVIPYVILGTLRKEHIV